ncbi:lambda-crystallin homolog [Tetranychus urticae]|uniref:3-hydroxyacyl-CoA dehydrogenase NAD binding domain-containing protein n=1 Tax=Tetranychus urticae TaxID=32264 RepID=T1K838_TETUR|nr:lambda-crystallin homolog [Tetranychus urticae]
MASKGKVAVIGSGLVGQNWAMIFASVGYSVQLYDVSEDKISGALGKIKETLKTYSDKGILRGNLDWEKQSQLITGTLDLGECLKDAFYVQECVFEDIALKQKVFSDIDSLVSESTIMASSTSRIPPSVIFEKCKNRSNGLIVHPINPPYFIPLVEIIKSPWTSEEVTLKARTLMDEVGQKPVVANKEVLGFIVNRIQFAIFAECYRLIEDKVISPEDVETVMSEGLGMRYAFLGPWETAHLNAAGVEDYFKKFGPGVVDVLKTFGPNPTSLDGQAAQDIIEAINRKVPLGQLEERRKWRDNMLIALSQVKRQS